MDDLIREFLIESQEGLDRMERCLTELEAQPADAALIGEIFRSVHTIKGTTGFLGFARLEKLAHAGENLLGLVREGAVPASALVITELLRLLDGLRAILRAIEADGSEGEGNDAALIGRLEELPAAVAETSQAAPALAPDNAARRETPAGGSGSESSFAAESTLRVDVALLNRLMNLVGELVLTRNQVLQATAADARMTHLSRRLDMVTADLREAVMKARMQPVSQVFSKMPRLVRDLAQLLGRRVRLEMKGQQTELDKSLLEAIKDPLTHAVRNALDHGIEPPTAREAAGKSPEGTLTLRAMHQGSHVLIEIADDGAGIAVERVRSKAIERGLIDAAQAGELSEGEVLRLIFLPGFSTASAVTTVSGRGVGMDVVRTNVEKIGGSVEIDSTVGKGTAIRLRIPLTLAIIPALIVHSGDESLALPQGALSELVRIADRKSASKIDGAARMNQIGEADPLHQFEQIDRIEQIDQIEWIGDAAVFRVRGRLLPLVFLDRLLGLEGLSERDGIGRDGSGGRDRFIVVLDVDGRRFGLVVDGLADPEEIVVKPLSAALKGIGLFSGATILGNGGLALILDPAAIALRARINHNAEASVVPCPAAAAEADHAEEYLLVDAGGRRAALPLGDVLRIERLKASRIEQVGARLVLHTAGELLPVEDIGGVFGTGSDDPDAPVIVVVCGRRVPHFGVLVSDLLDVAKGSALVEAGTSSAVEGVTLLADRVTGIVRTDALTIGMSLPEPEPLAMTAIAEVQP